MLSDLHFLLEVIFFSNSYYDNPIKFPVLKFTKVWPQPPPNMCTALRDWLTLESVTLTLVPREPLAINHLWELVSMVIFPGLLLWQVVTRWFPCLPSFDDSGFPFHLTFLTNLQRVFDFPVCSAFYLFFRLSGNLQSPYMTNGKEKLIDVLV